ncbi:hypothetical protein BJY16_008232 [Actinoplanes octamycinicus]|uniref:Uncharacterized protein n=1 Tax=Actinoplanes octamycinicus TaxID=135948 RepID=A0A7W7H6G7_9ACTN|nr:hypothetical protein [Actinoplanes octamycinicus]MBB4744773.1 hypothetical protein [Actinoplanes octamycinicus]GIE55356.1 hypothetical protein Aoc01nite_07580 [Actinoplanes octamycinicus]
MAEIREKYSVDGRRDHHALVRQVGWGAAGLGVLLILGVPVSAVRTARREAAVERAAAGFRAGPPLHPVPPHPPLHPLGETIGKRPRAEGVGGTVVLILVMALGSFVGLTFVIVDETIVAWLGMVVCLAFALAGCGSLVDFWRTRVGRRRWARSRGFLYRRFDHDLVARLNLPGLKAGKPFAEYVVFGAYQGLPFVVFTYRTAKGVGRNAWAMALPGAVPRLRVEDVAVSDRLGAGSAPGWREVWPGLRALADLRHPDEFSADGAVIWEDPTSKLSGVNAAELERRLLGLHTVGAALAATPVPERQPEPTS